MTSSGCDADVLEELSLAAGDCSTSPDPPSCRTNTNVFAANSYLATSASAHTDHAHRTDEITSQAPLASMPEGALVVGVASVLALMDQHAQANLCPSNDQQATRDQVEPTLMNGYSAFTRASPHELQLVTNELYGSPDEPIVEEEDANFDQVERSDMVSNAAADSVSACDENEDIESCCTSEGAAQFDALQSSSLLSKVRLLLGPSGHHHIGLSMPLVNFKRAIMDRRRELQNRFDAAIGASRGVAAVNILASDASPHKEIMLPNIIQRVLEFLGSPPSHESTVAAVSRPEHDNIPDPGRAIDLDLYLSLAPLDDTTDLHPDRSGIGIRADVTQAEDLWRKLQRATIKRFQLQ